MQDPDRNRYRQPSPPERPPAFGVDNLRTPTAQELVEASRRDTMAALGVVSSNSTPPTPATSPAGIEASQASRNERDIPWDVQALEQARVASSKTYTLRIDYLDKSVNKPYKS